MTTLKEAINSQAKKYAHDKKRHYINVNYKHPKQEKTISLRYYFVDDTPYNITPNNGNMSLGRGMGMAEYLTQKRKSLTRRFLEIGTSLVSQRLSKNWAGLQESCTPRFVLSNSKTQMHHPLYLYDGIIDRKKKKLIGAVTKSGLRLQSNVRTEPKL